MRQLWIKPLSTPVHKVSGRKWLIKLTLVAELVAQLLPSMAKRQKGSYDSSSFGVLGGFGFFYIYTADNNLSGLHRKERMFKWWWNMVSEWLSLSRYLGAYSWLNHPSECAHITSDSLLLTGHSRKKDFSSRIETMFLSFLGSQISTFPICIPCGR